MPWFVDFQKQYGPAGVQFLGVAMDDASTKDIAEFAQSMNVNYPILIGKESVGDAYGGVQFLPETFYIDRNGKVVDKAFGLKGRGEIEDDIKKILGPSCRGPDAKIDIEPHRKNRVPVLCFSLRLMAQDPLGQEGAVCDPVAPAGRHRDPRQGH